MNLKQLSKGNVLVFGLATILLSSCAAGVKVLDTYQIEKKREPLALENPAPLELQDIDWIIITKDNADEVFEKIKNEKNFSNWCWPHYYRSSM